MRLLSYFFLVEEMVRPGRFERPTYRFVGNFIQGASKLDNTA